jgi:hypothetical protein
MLRSIIVALLFEPPSFLLDPLTLSLKLATLVPITGTLPIVIVVIVVPAPIIGIVISTIRVGVEVGAAS